MIPEVGLYMKRQINPDITSGTVHGSMATSLKNLFSLIDEFKAIATMNPISR